MTRLLQSIALSLSLGSALLAAPAKMDSLMALLEPAPIATREVVEPTVKAPAAPVARPKAPVEQAPVAPVTTFELDRTTIMALLQSALTNYYSLEGELVVHAQETIRSVEVGGSYDLKILSAPSTISRSLFVRYQIMSDGKPVSTGALHLSAEHWQEVYVARQHARRGESPFEGDLIRERVDTLRQNYELVDAGIDLSDYELALPTQPNRPLGWRNLTTRPLVKKGAIVEAQARDTGLLITVPAVALQDGQQGEVIRVRNLQSRQDITAQVIDENLVQVHF
ncbi:MAG: flagella basal body P-ring formation protein FlgA [Puniceicoccaceae bacterium 5H]|nr:MAG: flagella basal body P-ring formation protein FlgA [Puniceicoccaceae bacterium 5H]